MPPNGQLVGVGGAQRVPGLGVQVAPGIYAFGVALVQPLQFVGWEARQVVVERLSQRPSLADDLAFLAPPQVG